MKVKDLLKNNILNAAHAVFLLAAIILSVISSNLAYAMKDISTLVRMGIITIILDAAVMVVTAKNKHILADLFMWVSTALSMLLMCGLIKGRMKLMGYVWFSDLESGNPIAVGALNLTVAAWVCIVLGICCICIIGFKREKR